jgi:hypothetical protein
MEFTFVNDFKSTRSGFNHYAKLFYNATLLSEAKVCYINRTWEEYRYQTVNRRAVERAIKQAKGDAELIEKLNKLLTTL